MMDGLEDLNVPRFYAFAALYYIGSEDIGRRRLAERLGLSESKTRTMLDHLRDAGYVTADDHTKLSGNGEELYSDSLSRVKRIERLELEEVAVGDINVAALVMGAESRIGSGLEVRDEAVRAGAEGMTVLHFEDGFKFPGEQLGEEELEELDEEFDDAWKGDALLISSAGSVEKAVAGLWRALFYVLDSA
ncbi:MAG: DUF4443 domain-containing protein [Candidatus Nanohaloarchaea archaeon]